MVVLYPTKDQAWRWQTSNSEYGKFYVSIHREVAKKPEGHNFCAKKCEALGKELNDCKAQLECMKICCGSPCKSEFEAHKDASVVGEGSPQPCNRILTSPKLGTCECQGRPGAPNPNPYISETINQYNGGKRHDPQFLVDHIKANHPRLVRRLQPKLPFTSMNRSSGDHFPRMDDEGGYDGGGGGGSGGRQQGGYDSGDDKPRRCKMIGLYKRPGTPDPPAPTGGYKRKMVGMYKRDENQPNKQRKFHSGGGGGASPRPPPVAAVNLPPSQRYNFYRYYEKLPGFSLDDIFYDVGEEEYARAMSGGYLEEIFPAITCTSPAPEISCPPRCASGGEGCDARVLQSDFSQYWSGGESPGAECSPPYSSRCRSPVDDNIITYENWVGCQSPEAFYPKCNNPKCETPQQPASGWPSPKPSNLEYTDFGCAGLGQMAATNNHKNSFVHRRMPFDLDTATQKTLQEDSTPLKENLYVDVNRTSGIWRCPDCSSSFARVLDRPNTKAASLFAALGEYSPQEPRKSETMPSPSPPIETPQTDQTLETMPIPSPPIESSRSHRKSETLPSPSPPIESPKSDGAFADIDEDLFSESRFSSKSIQVGDDASLDDARLGDGGDGGTESLVSSYWSSPRDWRPNPTFTGFGTVPGSPVTPPEAKPIIETRREAVVPFDGRGSGHAGEVGAGGGSAGWKIEGSVEYRGTVCPISTTAFGTEIFIDLY